MQTAPQTATPRAAPTQPQLAASPTAVPLPGARGGQSGYGGTADYQAYQRYLTTGQGAPPSFPGSYTGGAVSEHWQGAAETGLGRELTGAERGSIDERSGQRVTADQQAYAQLLQGGMPHPYESIQNEQQRLSAGLGRAEVQGIRGGGTVRQAEQLTRLQAGGTAPPIAAPQAPRGSQVIRAPALDTADQPRLMAGAAVPQAGSQQGLGSATARQAIQQAMQERGVTPGGQQVSLPSSTAATPGAVSPPVSMQVPGTGVAPSGGTVAAGAGTAGTGTPDRNALAQQILSQLETGTTEANEANEQRYQDILNLMEGVGTQGGEDIDQRTKERLAELGQQMVTSGLSGTSVPFAGQALIEREQGAEKRRLAEQVALMKTGVMERRYDEGPDTALYANLLGELGYAEGGGVTGGVGTSGVGGTAGGAVGVGGAAPGGAAGQAPTSYAGLTAGQATQLQTQITRLEEQRAALLRQGPNADMGAIYALDTEINRAKSQLNAYNTAKSSYEADAQARAEWDRLTGGTVPYPREGLGDLPRGVGPTVNVQGGAGGRTQTPTAPTRTPTTGAGMTTGRPRPELPRQGEFPDWEEYQRELEEAQKQLRQWQAENLYNRGTGTIRIGGEQVAGDRPLSAHALAELIPPGTPNRPMTDADWQRLMRQVGGLLPIG